MEAIYRRLEAWGYPVAAIDWLRKRRLLVITVLALLSWASVVVTGLGIYYGAMQLWRLISGADVMGAG